MLFLGASGNDKEVQLVGKNLTCNSTFKSIPAFASNFPSATITNFINESLAYSVVTNTLVACGGLASSQARCFLQLLPTNAYFWYALSLRNITMQKTSSAHDFSNKTIFSCCVLIL
jgi:hypothetical protein